ncbi:MAG: hypothetical protein EHM45_14030 [Desulfobacteraceae bacterium]|nr:MAG: hypothetical protein EHM45_14030 [Desulfobacteraceae bacterium]
MFYFSTKQQGLIVKSCNPHFFLKWFGMAVIGLLGFMVPGICAALPENDRIKVAIFNFNIQDIESSGYGSNITNQLINALGAYPSLAIMDRKELEHFLFLNEFHQNDNPQNIFTIGNRLGLEIIVAGKVGKQNSNIVIECRVFKIDRQTEVLNKNLKLPGDAKLSMELRELAGQINQAILESKSVTPDTSKPQETQIKEVCRLTAKPGRSKVTLFWNAPAAFVKAGYKIYRATSAAGPFVKIGQTDEFQYQDTEVEAKTPYFYKIKAYDSQGAETDFSALVQAGSVPTPEPPIILKAESHVKGVTVFWTPNPMVRPDEGKTISFFIYRSLKEDDSYLQVGQVEVKEQNTGGATRPALATFSFMNQSLDDGTEYFFKITAANQQGFESDFSKCIRQKTVEPVEKLAAEGDRIREIRLKWQPGEAPLAKGYVLYRSQKENEGFQNIQRIVEIKTAGFTDRTGLEDDRIYYYYLTVYEDQDRETGPSMIVSARTKGPPPPVAGLEAQSGLVKKVQLQWPLVAQDEISGYKIYRAQQEAGPYQLITVLKERHIDHYLDAGHFLQTLEDDTVYFYRVTTFNPVEVESRTYAAAFARTKNRPQKPEGVQAVGRQVQKATLSWQANKETIAHYVVFRKETGSESFSSIGRTGGETNYVDAGLKNGVEYQYRIKAEDKDGLVSDASDPVTVRTKPKPQAPQGLSVRYENKEAIVSWQANAETDIVSYVIYERFLILVNKTASVSGTEYRFNGLSSGSNKTVFLTAVDQDGLESEYSAAITITGP